MKGKDPAAMLAALESHLAAMGGAVVAFSGGVDSSLLAVAASRALGERAMAVTGRSPSLPARELETARRLAASFGFKHIEIDVREMDCPEYTANTPDRCYFCKSELFRKLKEKAAGLGMSKILDGNNADDISDYRPGSRAAREAGVSSPFMELGFGKEDIRAMSRLLDLPTAERPAQACLASRLAYGVPIEEDTLRMVEKAEEFVLSLGAKNVRVRVHPGKLARIEADEHAIELLAGASCRSRIFDTLKGLGFTHVSLDLKGYRTGSMNENIVKGR